MRDYLTLKNIIIAVGIGLLILIGVAWYNYAPSAGDDRGPIGFITNLFPSGNDNPNPPPPPSGQNNNIGTGGDNGQGQGGGGTQASADSFKIADNVAGATFYKGLPAQAGKIRYIDRATGNLYEMDPDGNNKNKISGTTISGIFEVAWSPVGDRAILRYMSGEKMSVASAYFSGSSTLTTFLPAGTKDAVFSPKGDRIVYVLASGREGSVITATPDNKSQTVRLKIPITSWRLSWPTANDIYLLTAPSAYMDGFLYKINLTTGVFSKVFGPIPGLTTNTNGVNLIYSGSNPNDHTFYSSVIGLAKNETSDFPFSTFPEKCSWSKKSNDLVFCAMPLPLATAIYPDDWYKGKVSFADTIIKTNTKDITFTSTLLPQAVDAINLFLSEDETLIFFIDKKDNSLWRAKLL